MEDSKPPVQYVLVRKDLPPFVQAVHVGHACGESIRYAPIDKRTIIRFLHVADEAELLAYGDKLIAKGFHFGLVYEPDGPYRGHTALATEPSTERISALSKLFYHLRAAGEDPAHVAQRQSNGAVSP